MDLEDLYLDSNLDLEDLEDLYLDLEDLDSNLDLEDLYLDLEDLDLNLEELFINFKYLNSEIWY